MFVLEKQATYPGVTEKTLDTMWDLRCSNVTL